MARLSWFEFVFWCMTHHRHFLLHSLCQHCVQKLLRAVVIFGFVDRIHNPQQRQGFLHVLCHVALHVRKHLGRRGRKTDLISVDS